MRLNKNNPALRRIHSAYNLPDTPQGWKTALRLLRQHNAPMAGKAYPRRRQLKSPPPPSPLRYRRRRG